MSSAFASALLPFITSVGFVTLNEMGDKTQLLAMAFATRMKFWKVMVGVFIATILNHGLAVLVGSMLARIPGWQGWIRFAAAVLFIFFGLWALVSDKLDGEEETKKSRGEIMTVAIGFFLAEMGDKTQLATITLSAQFSSTPLLVLAGTTCGMLIADGVGILAGVILHRTLPARALKVVASSVFVLFGLVGLWDSMTQTFRYSTLQAGIVVTLVGLVSLLLGALLFKRDQRKAQN